MDFFRNLFKPGWMSDDYRKAQNAFRSVKKRNSSAELIHVALTCPHTGLRAEAVNLLEEQNTLHTVALNDPSEAPRLNAVQRIEDLNFLADIAENTSIRSSVRMAALDRITDTTILLRLLLRLDPTCYDFPF